MGGKGSKGTAKNYFGSLAGVVCAGPVDELVSIILDGKTVWPTDKGWADDVVDLAVASVSRAANVAKVTFATPHGMHHAQKFVMSGLVDASFNVAVPTAITHNSDIAIKFPNVGANVATTVVTAGLLTKVVHYEVNDLVRYAGSIWKCILAHDGTPDKAPPNAVYWVSYSVLRATSPNPYPLTVATKDTSYGQCYFYWGTNNQTLDAVGEAVLAQNGHPPYRRQAVLVLKNFLFGTERQAAPNIEVMVRRKPVQTVVVGAATDLDSGFQANPVCAELDLLTDPVFGPGLPAAGFDAVTFQAIADELAAQSALTYISPYFDKAETVRSMVARLLAYFDGWHRFSAAGLIEAGRFLHNAAPPAFTAATTIDYNDLTDEIEWDTESWTSTFNQTVVKFEDGARAFKAAGQLAPSGFNRALVGEVRKATLERPWITREAQAMAYAAEWEKINAQERLSGMLKVRAEKAASIKQGDLFLLTHDALQLTIVCRCTKRMPAGPPVGKVSLRFENERGIAPLPYQPTLSVPGGTTLPSAEKITLYQFVQPPPALADSQDFRLIVLAARTSALAQGMGVWLKVDDGASFYELGEQRSWAVSATVHANYGVPAGKATEQRSRAANVATIKATAHGYATGLFVNVGGLGGAGYNLNNVSITVTDANHFTYPSAGANEGVTADVDGTVTPQADDDSELLQLDVDEFTVQADLDNISATQTADAINDNALLVWLFKAADPTQFEITTLKAIRLDAGVYKLKVRRGRFATGELAFVAGDLAWIGFQSDLVTYAHEKFATYAQSASAATFRLQSFTAYEQADLADPDVCPDIAFAFTDPYAPMVEWTLIQKNGVDIPDFTVTFLPTDIFTVGVEATDANADLIELKLVARLGSVEQIILSSTFESSARQLKSATFSLAADGVWRVFAVAKDDSGRVKEFELQPVGGGAAVQLHIDSSAGTTTAAPVADPEARDYPSTVHVTLTSATAGATIKYSKVLYGAAPGVYSTYTGAITVTLVGMSSKWTIYAYATHAGLTDSSVVRNDYWWASDL